MYFQTQKFKFQKQFERLSIAVTTSDPCLQLAAQNIANKYFLSYVNISECENFDFILKVSEQGLYLQNKEQKNSWNLQIDFLKGEIGYRLRHIKGQKQLLLKAIGLKPKPKIEILDLTAGWGNDGFVLAQLGFSVTLLERSPIIHALLADGLHRALNHEKHSHLNIKLIHSDSIIFLKQILKIKKFPDVIYLDPMYPHLNKSALARKEMCLLRKIVGDDVDAINLLPLALTCTKRVVVKRPRLAAFLAELPPHHSIFGKQHRFDIYLVTHN
ncbi:MAG: class I SAM-dependent methyltransferase [Rickettsiella sp.]|nr:class I SAM-dependent methyltransferase [Rickettsiella sp.]